MRLGAVRRDHELLKHVEPRYVSSDSVGGALREPYATICVVCQVKRLVPWRMNWKRHLSYDSRPGVEFR